MKTTANVKVTIQLNAVEIEELIQFLRDNGAAGNDGAAGTLLNDLIEIVETGW